MINEIYGPKEGEKSPQEADTSGENLAASPQEAVGEDKRGKEEDAMLVFSQEKNLDEDILTPMSQQELITLQQQIQGKSIIQF